MFLSPLPNYETLNCIKNTALPLQKVYYLLAHRQHFKPSNSRCKFFIHSGTSLPHAISISSQVDDCLSFYVEMYTMMEALLHRETSERCSNRVTHSDFGRRRQPCKFKAYTYAGQQNCMSPLCTFFCDNIRHPGF